MFGFAIRIVKDELQIFADADLAEQLLLACFLEYKNNCCPNENVVLGVPSL